MWLFIPGGLLMPSIVPEGKGDPAFTNNGLWMMQVRARVKSHLENFIRDYMEDGTYSDIEATPQMDYNFRFYTTHEQLALAVAKAILDIDYAKFKPTAERTDKTGKLLYPDGKAYHSTLNSIWSTVTKLGSPGGSWGAYSSRNPNGYKNASDYYSVYERPKNKRGGGNSRKWWQEDYDDPNALPVGASFFDAEGVDMEQWEKDQEMQDDLVIAETLMELMVETDLDVGQWFPFMTLAEDRALRSYATKCLQVKKEDLEPIEQDVVEHYFGADWETHVAESAKEDVTAPFENMDSNVQFEKVAQKPSQRRNNRRAGKRNKGKNKVARGTHFN